MLDLVANAAGDRDPPRQRIGAAEVERDIVVLAQRRERGSRGAFGADGEPAGELLERVADAHDRALAAALGGIGILDLADVAGEAESLPADRDPEVVADR